MTAKLPPSASVASNLGGAKLHAPSAARNTDALCNFLLKNAPQVGQALEIASGTGQHVMSFATALPDLIWQPTDIDGARLASIDAYAAHAGLANLKPAAMLDATQVGWHREHADKDLIVLVNLLHLISDPAAESVFKEAMLSLASGGKFILYGPFKRDGILTSAGDASFDADLREADPRIGYKNDADVMALLRQAGAASVQITEMPSNNLAFTATKP
ncbi:MAG: DUF938 domain-containing protein [Paracoccaceae bacterium]|nr:DUF938 domain-containing protein [Paracoccaceae bacterium]